MSRRRSTTRGRAGVVCAVLAVLAGGMPSAGDRDRRDALDELPSYKTPYYVVHSDLDIETVREAAARMTAMAETYHRRTKGFAGTIRSRLPFYVFANPADYYDAGGPAGSAGVFMVRGGKGRLMAIGTARLGGHLWHVVQHEGFHQFAWYVISRNLPVWVNEGLAEYFGEALWTGDDYVTGVIPAGRATAVKRLIREDQMLPFKDMLTMTAETWRDRLSSRNYRQAWSMVHFFVHADDGRYRKALSRYVGDIARGRDALKAFARRFGRDLEKLQKRYADWWTSLPADPTPGLRTEATVATLTSFLARTRIARVTVQSAEEFFDAAREGRIAVDGRDHPRLWLPASLARRAVGRAEKLGDWSLEDGRVLRLRRPDGTVFTGTYKIEAGRPRVSVAVEKPARAQPASRPASQAAEAAADAPGGGRHAASDVVVAGCR
jgi:hypothetical protein